MTTSSQPRLTAFVAAVIAAGIAATAVAVQAAQGSLLGTRPATFLIFAALLLVGELRPVRWLRRREGGSFTASWTFACSLLLISPAAGAMLATAAASFVADVINRRPLSKAAFNAANLALSLGVGAVVLSFAGRGLLIAEQASLVSYIPIASIALIALFLVNGLLTSCVIALAQEVAILPMLRQGVSLNVSTDGMLLALAPIFVVVSERSLMLIPLLLLTAWAVYRSAELALERHHASLHDPLTDLPNRTAFLQQLDQSLEEGRRRGHSLAVVMLDLDGFKEVNDRLGHAIGDLVLQEVSVRLVAALRATDVAGRLGGDEFALVLNRVDEAAAEAAMLRLREILSQPLIVRNFPVRVGGSLGLAMFPKHGEDGETLMSSADMAMYNAKQNNLGVQVYTPGRHARSRGRLMLLTEIQAGLDNDEFVLHYQPKVNLRTGAVVGVEALVRWIHPASGMIPPDDFMPLAEHTELMTPFTEYVVRAALRQCAEWQQQGLVVPVAVNASARNLHDVRFPSMVRAALEETGVDGRLLELEITENTVMADPARSAAVLHELKGLGVSLSIDDFGTGFSSLANLRDLPVDQIKIDRSFVTHLAHNPGDALIVRSIIELAANLSLGTIAEGVEDAATVHALREFGGEIAQGFYFSKPVPAAALEGMLRGGSIVLPPAPAPVLGVALRQAPMAIEGLSA